MRNILLKEMRLGASAISYIFILFALMFFLPGYPILCAAFFPALGIYKSFEYAREANDTLFSVLLPIAKRDVVRGKYCFVCFIEGCALLLMGIVVLIRMTVFSASPVYVENVLMNANLFALAAAFFLFGLFNWIFLGGFFKTGYNLGKPFIIYMTAAFIFIGVFETLHHLPHLGWLNAFGTEQLPLQMLTLAIGIVSFILMTALSLKGACENFEKTDF